MVESCTPNALTATAAWTSLCVSTPTMTSTGVVVGVIIANVSPDQLKGPDDRRADRTVTGWLPSSSYEATFRGPAGAAQWADRSTQ